MEEEITALNTAPVGSIAKVVNVIAYNKQRDRMLDLGIVKNSLIEVLQKSPFGDPTAYFIKGAVIALRKEDAKKIFVKIIQ